MSDKVDLRFIRPLADGKPYPTGIVEVNSGRQLRDGANILEIMKFIEAVIPSELVSKEEKPGSKYYVYRAKYYSPRRTYEIGECDDPRSSPEKWCDRRLCVGFHENKALVEKIVDFLNMVEV